MQGHLDLEQVTDLLKFQFDGVHIPSTGAIYALMSPNGCALMVFGYFLVPGTDQAALTGGSPIFVSSRLLFLKHGKTPQHDP